MGGEEMEALSHSTSGAVLKAYGPPQSGLMGVMSWPQPQPLVFQHCVMTEKPASCQQSGPERGMKMADYETIRNSQTV
ncbi:hypothetical protein ABG768_022488, partial [Culter alburnus]